MVEQLTNSVTATAACDAIMAQHKLMTFTWLRFHFKCEPAVPTLPGGAVKCD